MTKRHARSQLFSLFIAASLLIGAVLSLQPTPRAQAEVSLPPIPVGVNPKAVAVNPVTNKIYVVNLGSNSVTVIDGATTSTTTVAVGTWPNALAVNSITNKVYVANTSSANVTVIDGATNDTTTVATGRNPVAVAVNSVTNKVYVANHDTADVTVIDGATNGTTTIPFGGNATDVAINQVTNKIYVPDSANGQVMVIDGATNGTTYFSIEACGTRLYTLAVNPVTNKIYVADKICRAVTVIDGATNATSFVGAGYAPSAVAVNPVTNKIYVANGDGNDVTVIDGATNATTTVAAGYSPSAVAVNPATNKVYVANWKGRNITVINGATNGTTTVAAGDQPTAVAVNPETSMIYVANTMSNDVTVIDGRPLASSAKTVSLPRATFGSSLTYTVTVTNQGAVDLTSVAMTDTLPADLTYVDGSLAATSGVYTFTEGVIRWDGALNINASVTITYETTVSESASLGDLVNAAVISSSGDGPITRTATTTIVDPLAFSSKSVDWPARSADSPLTFTIWLRNEGLVDIPNAIVTDTLPASLAYLPGTLAAPSGDYGYADGTIYWTGIAPARQTVPITFSAQLDPAFRGEIINTAFISHAGVTITRTAATHLGLWYVTPQGNDGNDCLSPTTPCATINGAIGKAASGDTIYVATGTYIGDTGSEVVLLRQSVNLSGGWDAAFTSQDGVSTIDGQSARRGITVDTGVTAQLERLIVQNGKLGRGAGLDNWGTLNVVSCTFSANVAPCPSIDPCRSNDPFQYGGGGGLYNRGTMTVTNSSFSGNSAIYGGGLYNRGTLTLISSTFSGNSTPGTGYGSGGGGIYNTGTMTVTNTTFSSNIAGASSHGGIGGGLINEGTLTVVDSIFAGNTAVADWGGSAAGGLYNTGTSTIVGSTFVSNTAGSGYYSSSGGGIVNSGTLTATNCTFAANTASATSGGFGGGLFNQGLVTIVNSTFSGNTAGGGGGYYGSTGGGLYNGNEGRGTIINCTFSGNTANPSTSGTGGGGGLANGSIYVTLTVRNTIMANSLGGGGDCRNTGSLVSAYNLVEATGTDACGLSNGADGNLVGQDPLLGDLQDNGGPTWTHALLAGSPAIDAGDNATCPAIDQRGFPRLGPCDIGAVEKFPLEDSAKTVSRAMASHGSTLSYAINLPNDIEDVSPVTVTDTLPAFLTYVDNSLVASTGSYGYDNGVITWTGSVNKGETVTITFDATLDQAAPPGSFANVATIDVVGKKFMRAATTKVVYYTHLPLTLGKRCMSGICGRVTQNGSPVAGLPLELRFYDGSSWSTRATTVTDPNGIYSFAGMPALGAEQAYYVLYRNTTRTSSRLWVWGTRSLTTYAANSNVEMGVFDIADITLGAPGSGDVISLPYNFTWIRRPASPTDTYEFDLYDANNDTPYFYTPLLGYVSSYNLTCLPTGFAFGTYYLWDVWVYSPDGGYGLSYWSRWVKFSSGPNCTAAASQPNGDQIRQLPENLRDLESRPRP